MRIYPVFLRIGTFFFLRFLFGAKKYVLILGVSPVRNLLFLGISSRRNGHFVHICHMVDHVRGLALALAPSVVVVWAPVGADLVHFACFGLDFRGWWGPRPRPSVVVGPFGG